eukprot:Plantae.Rhodophyta-Purpureofilum_apyrenoidigerum.ctg22258.p1 GENE.Plantae.Rhodophyta-Purpureofilum_apyrenoidigerum.ctg22258~~Plantae.Rhodophyta-Purpureofilum_apyrenoidigerum.ctg22258.p1  ORF type:complete len:539 (-),score=82.62 Plantae.Rhodophyta-Purpureofilum_apyrenoidigerum.ctg22258:352-1947(-)
MEDEGALSDEGINAFATFIIRPPRSRYELSDLGNVRERIYIQNANVVRRDFEVVNDRSQRLQCSIWEPETEASSELPCVIYLHGNASSRAEARSVISAIVPYNIKLVGVDLSGSGMSEGDFISLGYYEKSDVAALVKHLLDNRMASRIALWGHSMGASTAIMYCGSYPAHHIKCMILDSGYASFDKLAEETVERMPLPPGIPRKLLLSVGVRHVRKIVRERAGFDLNEVQPAKSAKQVDVPAVIIHGMEDEVVSVNHAAIIFKNYACQDKELIKIEGGHHDSPRPSWVDDKAFLLLQKHFCTNLLEYVTALKNRGNVYLLSEMYDEAIQMFTRAVEAAADSLQETGPSDPSDTPSKSWHNYSLPDGAFARIFRDKGKGSLVAAEAPASAKKWPKLFKISRKDRPSAKLASRGSKSFLDGLNVEAVSSLSKDALTEDQKTRLSKVVVTIYGNRSLAYAKKNDAQSALNDAEKVLDLDPSWSRGYHRKAAALKLNGQMQEAINTLDRGLELDSENKGLVELREELKHDLRNST